MVGRRLHRTKNYVEFWTALGFIPTALVGQQLEALIKAATIFQEIWRYGRDIDARSDPGAEVVHFALTIATDCDCFLIV